MSRNPPPKGRNYPFAQRGSAFWEQCHVTYDQAVDMYYDQTAMQQHLGHDPIVNSLVYKRVKYPTIFDAQRAYTQDQNSFYQKKEQEQLELEAKGIEEFKKMNDAIRGRLNPTEDGLANPLERPLKPMGDVSKGIFEQFTNEVVHEPSGRIETNSSSALSPYLTGNYPRLQAEPTYPIYKKNTRTLPDQQVRDLLQANNLDVLLLTLSEIFAYLQTEGWKQTKKAWVEATDTTLGQIMINYGPNGKDVVTTSMVISKLGSLGIKATVEVNHLGNEIIKFTGWPNIRKILNAPRFRLDNPKVVDVGIGKYGLKNSIVSGARLTFYVAAAYRTVDFILNDETSLSRYIGSLATDIVKIGVASAVSWTAGAITMALTSFAVGPLVVAVGVGLLTSIGLNYFDNKHELTDQVVAYIEHAQQEAVETAREIERGFLDIGKMFVDGLLDTGRKIFVSELKNYVRKTVDEIMPRSI